MYPREIEASVQMRLYKLNKRQFVIVFFLFFFLLALSILAGLVGPPILSINEQSSKQVLVKGNDIEEGPFQMRSPSLSVFHQQMWVKMKIIPSKDLPSQISLKVHMSVQIQGVTGKDGDNPSIYGGNLKNKSRLLKCHESTCEDIIVFHLGYLEYTSYKVQVTFLDLKKRAMHLDIQEILFSFVTYNPSFTQFEIWYRFLFLLFSFIASLLFAQSLRRFMFRDWSIEQKWMSLLLPLLLLYNNPLLSLTFLVNSWVPGMLDAIFQAIFLCALLLFWLCIYHGVRQTNRHFMSFYLPKLIVVGLIFITAVTLASWQAYNEARDPTYNYIIDTGNFMGFKIVFFTIGILYVLYFTYLLIRACGELKSMPYFNLRLRFLTALMIIVIAATITITALRFGTGILEENFVAALSTHYGNSVEFSAFYGLLNLYLFTMAYVYSPAKNAVLESHFSDNPTISMLNDSDEDVIYGSDYEETSMMADVRSK